MCPPAESLKVFFNQEFSCVYVQLLTFTAATKKFFSSMVCCCTLPPKITSSFLEKRNRHIFVLNGKFFSNDGCLTLLKNWVPETQLADGKEFTFYGIYQNCVKMIFNVYFIPQPRLVLHGFMSRPDPRPRIDGTLYLVSLQ